MSMIAIGSLDPPFGRQASLTPFLSLRITYIHATVPCECIFIAYHARTLSDHVCLPHSPWLGAPRNDLQGVCNTVMRPVLHL
jgi:hypothetical protein